MNTTVIHNICLYHSVAIGRNDVCQCITQQVIADMAQMERLIRIGRRIFNHHQRGLVGNSGNAILYIRMDAIQQFNPCRRSDSQVQEPFDNIECRNRRLVCLQIFANLLCRLLRSFLRHAEKRENNQRKVSLKFFLGFLQLHLCSRNILSVQRFQSANYGRYQFLFYIHDSNVFSVRKDTNYF